MYRRILKMKSTLRLFYKQHAVRTGWTGQLLSRPSSTRLGDMTKKLRLSPKHFLLCGASKDKWLSGIELIEVNRPSRFHERAIRQKTCLLEKYFICRSLLHCLNCFLEKIWPMRSIDRCISVKRRTRMDRASRIKWAIFEYVGLRTLSVQSRELPVLIEQ